ncbi:MAG: translation initiation factor [Planctomycetes bacterium]|nr:translation initiation factor [Planctomycetota bacterium]
MAKKITRGDGWELIPAGGAEPDKKRPGWTAPPAEQRIRVREEKRAQGKIVTVASGFRMSEADLKTLAKDLKAHCGAGGTAEGDTIEVQGRHQAKVVARLERAGFGVV